MIQQKGHIGGALTQGRHLNPKHIYSIEQIGSEAAFRNLKFKISVGRAN
jgi:hypothetical protein